MSKFKTTYFKYLGNIIILWIFFCSSVNAYDLDISKKDSAGNIVKNGLVVPIEKKLIVTGYGKTKDMALNNALKSAVEQYIGVVVDAEIIISNDKLIKNEILTATSGYVKTYDEISTRSRDGLVEVKINATVESQKIFKKIQSLKISTIPVNYDTENIYTRVTTKNQSKKESEVLLKKYYNNFCNAQCVQELLTIKPLKISILEEEIKNDLVPVVVSFRIGVNYDIYSNRVKYLENNLKNIGGTLYSRYDLPKVSDNTLIAVNHDKLRKLSGTDIGFVKKYGKGYKLDVWKFPKKWNDIYPFKLGSRKSGYHWAKSFNIIIEFKNKEKSVIQAFNLTEGFDLSGVKDCLFYSYSNSYRYACSYNTYYSNDAKIFTPFLMRGNSSFMYQEIKATFSLSLDDLRNLQNVSIELEQK